MATTIDVKLLIDTADSAKTLRETQKALKAITDEAARIGEGKAGFNELNSAVGPLQKKLAGLKDSADDLKDSMGTLKGSGIEKVSASFGLLKESVANVDFGKFKIGLKGLATAFDGVGIALASIGIGLVIKAVSYLIEHFDELKESSGALGTAMRFVGDIISKVTEGIMWLLDAVGLVNGELDKQSENLTNNAKKGKEAIDKQNKAYDEQIAILKANGKSTVELEVAKQKAIVETNKALVQQTIDFVRSGGQLTAAQKEVLTSQLEAINSAVIEQKVIIDTAATVRRDKAKEHNKELAKIEKDRRDQQLKDEAADIAALQKFWDDYYKDQRDQLQKSREDTIDDDDNFYARRNAKAIKTAQNALMGDEQNIQKKRDLLEAQRREEIRIAQETGGDVHAINRKYAKLDDELKKSQLNAGQEFAKKINGENDGIKQSVEQSAAATISILDSVSEYNQLKADEQVKVLEESLSLQLSNLNAARDAELAKEGLTNDQKIAIQNKYAQQEYELKLKAYNTETAIKKKAFEQDKKLKIAQAVISTITGTVAAVTSALASSIPYPGNIIAAALSGAAVAAAGVIQIAKIKASTFDAGSPPSPPNLAMPSSAGSSNNDPNQGTGSQARLFNINGDKDTGGNGSSKRESQPIRAYVVSQEVTQSQDMNKVIERRSSF